MKPLIERNSIKGNATGFGDSRYISRKEKKKEQRIYRLAAWQGRAQGFAEPRLPVPKLTLLERLECMSVSLLGKDLQNGVANCSGISVSNQKRTRAFAVSVVPTVPPHYLTMQVWPFAMS